MGAGTCVMFIFVGALGGHVLMHVNIHYCQGCVMIRFILFGL